MNILEHLFGSKTRVKLLRLFFGEPEKLFYVRELTRLLDIQINGIRRELQYLTQSGIIKEMDGPAPAPGDDPHEGKRKYYALDPRSVLYPELRALLLKSYALGEQSLAEDLKKLGEVYFLLFTGVFINADSAPIDLLVVGSMPERAVRKLMTDFEQEYGFPIRYTLFSLSEYQERKSLMDRFLYAILEAPHEVAINTI